MYLLSFHNRWILIGIRWKKKSNFRIRTLLSILTDLRKVAMWIVLIHSNFSLSIFFSFPSPHLRLFSMLIGSTFIFIVIIIIIRWWIFTPDIGWFLQLREKLFKLQAAFSASSKMSAQLLFGQFKFLKSLIHPFVILMFLA